MALERLSEQSKAKGQNFYTLQSFREFAKPSDQIDFLANPNKKQEDSLFRYKTEERERKLERRSSLVATSNLIWPQMRLNVHVVLFLYTSKHVQMFPFLSQMLPSAKFTRGKLVKPLDFCVRVFC